MQLQPVTRKPVRTRLAIVGDDGTGKTLSALLIAFGICGDWDKVALIDTEQRSSSYHSYLGRFNVLPLDPPYHPDRFEKAILLCENAGMEVIVVDSCSPAWAGEGGVLDQYNSLPGTHVDRYKEVMMQHRCLEFALHNSEVHTISTVRSEKGQLVQENHFLQPFTTSVKLDEEHRAHIIRDRTNLFRDEEPFALTPETGQRLAHWCKSCSLDPFPKEGKEPALMRFNGELSDDIYPLCPTG